MATRVLPSVDAELLPLIRRAAAVIRRGGVVAIPTETLYGLAVDPSNAEAVARVFALKGRPDGKPLPLVAANLAQVEVICGPLTNQLRLVAARAWPGPLTLVLPALPGLADAVTAGTGCVGIRVPSHPVTQALCEAVGGPLTATSANRSGDPATHLPAVVARTFGTALDLLLDAGPTPGGAPSTVVSSVDGVVRLVREGAIPWLEVQRWLTMPQ